MDINSFKNKVADRMRKGTQYGCHEGYDAFEYAEMMAPHPDLGGKGKPKGDNNRKPSSPKQGTEGYFTVGNRS